MLSLLSFAFQYSISSPPSPEKLSKMHSQCNSRRPPIIHERKNLFKFVVKCLFSLFFSLEDCKLYRAEREGTEATTPTLHSSSFSYLSLFSQPLPRKQPHFIGSRINEGGGLSPLSRHITLEEGKNLLSLREREKSGCSLRVASSLFHLFLISAISLVTSRERKKKSVTRHFFISLHFFLGLNVGRPS